MSDDEIIHQFEAGRVSPESFHHADHVRLAFAYLRQYPALTALDRFSNALRQFAASLGKADRYNETITYAYLFLIREKMAQSPEMEWEEFARQNPDLLVGKYGILNRYYEQETLKSDFARKVFVFPDKCR
jgi:hypothetical protein